MACEIIHGDALEVLKGMEANSVDAVVTDPPYGLAFMGKKWDYDVPTTNLWAECLRVLKPGGHLLAFAGTRTQHRMAVRIEDAGFEIRDMIAWVYGSGFPKSLDVSKAIDRAAGKLAPEGQGFTVAGYSHNPDKLLHTAPSRGYVPPLPATPEAEQWKGWGTALKPSYEPLTLARKPLDIRTHCVYLAQYLTSQICQYSASVRDAAPSSSSSQNVSSAEPSDFVLWTAVGGCNTPGDLFALMDTLAYGSELPLTLSTVCSWLRTLDGLLQHESTFTTETVSSLTTDLKTLNSLLSTTTPAFTIEELTEPSGRGSSAELVACIFNAFDASLKSILARFVHGNAIAKAQENYRDAGVSPSLEPITVARKPLVGTVAANVLEHGTGALNIDGCRVATDENLNGGAYAKDGGRAESQSLHGGSGMNQPGKTTGREFEQPTGRWPANLIHDGSEEVVAGFPESKDGVAVRHVSGGKNCHSDAIKPAMPDMGYGGSGSAARFFKTCEHDDFPLLLCDAKAIFGAWKTSPANTAESPSHQPSPSADFVRDLVLFAEHYGATLQSRRWTEHFTNATPIELSDLCTLVTMAILFTEARSWRVSQPAKHTLPNSRVSIAETNEQTGITTITIDRSTSDGFAEVATFGIMPLNAVRGEAASASRLVYCAKASKSDRGESNGHPTVKPTELMRYLVRLVTQPGGTVLDPFTGSGSTGKAAVLEGFEFIGIEREAEYVAIAEARIVEAQRSLGLFV
jgi:hypothetical protein